MTNALCADLFKKNTRALPELECVWCEGQDQGLLLCLLFHNREQLPTVSQDRSSILASFIISLQPSL